jgi:energy-coupling factor transporter transmembrane protein EcfT
MIPYGIVGLIVAAFFLGWLFRLPSPTRTGFMKSGLMYFTGAFLIEGMGGWYYSIGLEKDFIYSLFTTIEESFEIFGLITFLYFVTKFLITEVGIKEVELAG